MSNKLFGSQGRAQKCLLDLQMACYHAVHDYPGGAAAIAAMSGTDMPVLQKKLNPNLDTHKINVRDLQTICEVTQDERVLQTICSYYDASYFLLPDAKEISQETLLQQGADLTGEVAKLMQTVSQSVIDGKVNQDEVKALDKSLMELIGSAKALIEHAKLSGNNN
jgi:hypothetical protein